MGDMFSQALERRKERSRQTFNQGMQQSAQSQAAIDEQEDGKAFELAFGFIPTFNVGTALGVDNAVARLAMDILLDPFGLAMAATSGGLTLTGKVAQAASKLGRAGTGISNMAHLNKAEKLSGVNDLYKAISVGKNAPEFMFGLRAAAEAGDVNGLIKHTKELGKMMKKGKLDREMIQGLPTVADLRGLKNTIRLQTKAGLAEETIPLLAATRIAQAERKQRALLKVQIPFMAQTEKVLVQGNKVWNKFDTKWPLSPYAVAPGFAGIKTVDDIVGTMYDTRIADIQEARAVALVKNTDRIKELEVIAPGAMEKGITHLATFIREGQGMPLARAEALGLDTLFAAAGIKAKKFTKNIQGVSTTSEAFVKTDLLELTEKMGWGHGIKYLSETMDNHYSTFLKYMNESKLGIEIGELKDYIQHIYKVAPKDDGLVTQLATKMRDSGAFQQKRAFESLFDAEVLGKLEPGTTDSLELMLKYHEASVRIMQNRQFYKNVRGISIVDDALKVAATSGKVGEKVAEAGTEVPMLVSKIAFREMDDAAQAGYTFIDNPIIKKAVNSKIKIGETAGFSLAAGTAGGRKFEVLKKNFRASMVTTIKKSAGFKKSSGPVQKQMINTLNKNIDDIATEVIQVAEKQGFTPKGGTASAKIAGNIEKNIDDIVTETIDQIVKQNVVPRAGTATHKIAQAFKSELTNVFKKEIDEIISKAKSAKGGASRGRIIRVLKREIDSVERMIQRAGSTKQGKVKIGGSKVGGKNKAVVTSTSTAAKIGDILIGTSKAGKAAAGTAMGAKLLALKEALANAKKVSTGVKTTIESVTPTTKKLEAALTKQLNDALTVERVVPKVSNRKLLQGTSGAQIKKALESQLSGATTREVLVDKVVGASTKAGTAKGKILSAAEKAKEMVGAEEIFEFATKGKNFKKGTAGGKIKNALSRDIGDLIEASKKQPILEDLVEGDYIRKELVPYLDVLTQKPISNGFTNAIEQFNAVTKSIALAGSLFHSLSLTESAFAAGGVKGLQFAGKQGFGIPFVSQKLVQKGYAKKLVDFTQQEIVDAGKWINIDMSTDVRIGALNTFLDETSTFTGKFPGGKVLDGLTKYPKSLIRANNEALWENFHVPMKVWTFNSKMAQLMKDPRFANMTRDQIAKVAGAHVDRAFGGVNWERIMASPQAVQAWHWTLLAPDWTYSNMAVFTSLGGVGPKEFGKKLLKFPITKDLEDLPILGNLATGGGQDALQIALANQYWKNAAFAFLGTTQLASLALNGHTTWDNPSGFKWDIKLPWQDGEDRDQFVKIGKQLREPLRWMTDPFAIFGSKLSPGFQTVIEQLSAHSSGGYPTEFATKQGRLPMTAMESIPKRVKAIGAKFIPFSFGGNQIFFALPTKAYSQTSAVRALVGAVEGNDPLAVKELMKLSVANGHNIGRVRGIVKQETRDVNGLLNQSLE